MSPTTPETPQVKRRRLYDAAEPLLIRFGLAKTSVGEICREAGVSKRTFYELFGDKTDLYAHLVLQIHDDAVAAWHEELEDALPASKKLEGFVELYAGLLTRRPVLRLIYDLDVSRLFKDLSEELMASSLFSCLGELLEEGQADGSLRAFDPRSAQLIVVTLLDSLYYLLPSLTALPGAADDPMLAAETRRFLMAGLLAPEAMPSSSTRSSRKRRRPGKSRRKA